MIINYLHLLVYHSFRLFVDSFLIAKCAKLLERTQSKSRYLNPLKTLRKILATFAVNGF